MKSYLKFLFRNKLYTIIEALGLIIGLAFVIITGCYVVQQLSAIYDNPDYNRIYAVGDEYRMMSSCMDKEFLESRIPEIDAIARISSNFHKIETAQDIDCINLNVDKEFFDIFPQYTVIEGSIEHFGKGKVVVVSQTFASKFEENKNILGQTIMIDGEEYVICGVVKDVQNSLLLYVDMFIPYSEEKSKPKGIDHPFGDSNTTTIIRLKKGSDEKIFKEKVFEILKERNEIARDDRIPDITIDMGNGQIFNSQSCVNKIYNYQEMFFTQAHNSDFHKGDLNNLRALLTVVIVLLFMSIINYVNLNMALAGKRAKEMATRQLLGASRAAIIRRYIMESVLFTAICFGFALLMAYALVPTINQLLFPSNSDQYIQIQLLMKPAYIMAYFSGILLLGILAGILPALLASRYKPIEVVQGTYRQHRKLWYNKFFIVFQCLVAIILMSVAFVMEVQMLHMKNRDMHCQTQDLMHLMIGHFSQYDEYNEKKDIPFLVEEMKKLPCVEEFGFSDGYPGFAIMSVTRKNVEDIPIALDYITCDSTTFRILGFEIIKEFDYPGNEGIWIGEKAFVETGLSDTDTYFMDKPVMGIIRDFPLSGAAEANDKYNGNVFVRVENNPEYYNGVIVKTVGNHEEVQKQIFDLVENTEYLGLDYVTSGYIDELNMKKLEPTKRTIRLLEIFMLLSVMLSMLGLVAISTYYGDESINGIAVRKVFGSTVNKELWCTVKDYMILVGVASLMAAPVAFWLCGRYLEQFAYRIEHFGWIIAMAVIVAMLLAFVSVLWQSLRAARINPAEVLKKE